MLTVNVHHVTLHLTAYCEREMCYHENAVMQATQHCCHWPRKLRKVHRCSIMVNDMHSDNIVLVADGTMARVFFVDFSHSVSSPSLAQCEEELCGLHAVFSRKNT